MSVSINPIRKASVEQVRLEPEDMKWIYRELRKIELFSGLSLKECEKLVQKFCKCYFNENYKIVNEGEKGDAFYLIYKGKVSVWCKKGILKTKQKIRELKSGDFFGEIALLLDAPRTATVKTQDKVVAFVLFRRDFEQILAQNKTFAETVEFKMRERKLSDTLM